MKRLFLVIVMLAGVLRAAPAAAQDGAQATVIPQKLNMRAAPQPDSSTLGSAAHGDTLIVIGRGDDLGQWVYALPVDDGARGWVQTYYLDFAPGFDLASLPLTDAAGIGAPSSEPALVNAALPALTTGTVNLRNGPGTSFAVIRELSAGTPATLIGRSGDGAWLQAQIGAEYGWLHISMLAVEGDPAELPALTGDGAAAYPVIPAGVIPTVGDRARQIFESGSMRPNAFAKIGDSITDNTVFLVPVGMGRVQLRDYGYLQTVIDDFTGESFAQASLAARGGWTSGDLLDPAHSLPGCQVGEVPLLCEYRRTQPAVALIQIGTNDIYYDVDSALYRANLERIVQVSLDRGVIPVVSTIPDYHADAAGGARAIELNAIIREVAAAYQVPLWDYWLALQALPNQGMSGDGYHPSINPAGSAIFSPDGLQYGYTMRNLTALLVLDAVWRGALADVTPK